MKNLKEFSESVVNRSNNNGKLNYVVLSELLGKDFHKNPKFVQFSSKSDEKKSLRKIWQKYILHVSTEIQMYTEKEKKEVYDIILSVQGSFKSAKELYNAKNFEREESAKILFSAFKPFLNGSKVSETKETKVSENKNKK